MQHYLIKFVSDLRQVGGFFPGTLVSSTNKTDRHNITEMLLKANFIQFYFVNRYGASVSQICSVCHNSNRILSSFMTYHRVCNKSNTTSATYGAGTA